MDNIKIMYSELTGAVYIVKVNSKGKIIDKRELEENEIDILKAKLQ